MIFLKPPKNIKIQDFEPPKMVPAYVYIYENLSPPLPPPPTHTFLGHQGVKSGRYKK